MIGDSALSVVLFSTQTYRNDQKDFKLADGILCEARCIQLKVVFKFKLGTEIRSTIIDSLRLFSKIRDNFIQIHTRYLFSSVSQTLKM